MKSYLSKLAVVSTFSSLLAFGSVYALNSHEQAEMRHAIAAGTVHPHDHAQVTAAQHLLRAGIPITAQTLAAAQHLLRMGIPITAKSLAAAEALLADAGEPTPLRHQLNKK